MYHSASVFGTGKQMSYRPWGPFCKIMCTRCNLVHSVKNQKRFLNACLWAPGMSCFWQQRLGIQRWQRNCLPLSSTHKWGALTPSQGVLDTTWKAHEKQNHLEPQFSNEGLGAQRNIWVARRPHTLSTLSWPWRPIGKIYAEVANHSDCFFPSKFTWSCWQSPLQRGQGHQSTPNSSRVEPLPLDVTGLPVHSLKSCASSKSLTQAAIPAPSFISLSVFSCQQQVPARRITKPRHREPGTRLTLGTHTPTLYSRETAFLILLPPSQVKSRDPQMAATSCTSPVLLPFQGTGLQGSVRVEPWRAGWPQSS